MTTEKATFWFFCIPPSFFIIQKGWPFLCHKLKVGVVVVKHGNGTGESVSNVHGGQASPT